MSFDRPDPQCITNNSFNFLGLGDYKNGSTFNWQFGNNALPSIATTENVNGIVYDTPGIYPVTYTVNWNDCIGEFTDSIQIHQEPIINFDVVPGLYCAPQNIQFIDNSTADSPISYSWDFGDGNSSSQQNPSNVYENPGSYDVTLQISTAIGCVSTLTMAKPDLVEVSPSPVAAFSITPDHLTIFDSEVTISDESIDSHQHFYQLTPEVDTAQRNLTFHYTEGGYHYPYQVVTNEFGCVDTTYRTVYLEPYTTLYVPTAFTPDGNRLNNVFLPIVLDVTDYEFIIYNRWGEVFFKTTNTKEGWDGRVRGHPSPDGVYVWRIQYINHLQIGEVHQGSVTLLR